MPAGYQVVYADPPWPSPGGFAPNPETYPSHAHYKCMKVDEICALRVRKMVAEDAVLFLWSTGRDLSDAINRVIPAWGFKYKTVGFNWLKLTSKRNPVKVMGYFFFSSTELCLFATRGKPARLHAGLSVKVDSLVMEERIRHSQKPDEVRNRIARLFPGTRRIELFARAEHEGWDCWGDEVKSTKGIRL